MKISVVVGALFLFLLDVTYAALAQATDNSAASGDAASRSESGSGAVPETSSTTTTTTTTTSTTSTTTNVPSTSSTTTTALDNTTTFPPLVVDKWSNMSMEFFIIFVCVSGGVGVIAFIVITAVCCREYKLLETSDDSDEESVYSESYPSSSPSPFRSSSPGDELETVDVTGTETERSWDPESNSGSPVNDENASQQPQRRHRRHHHRHHRGRSRSRSCSVMSAPSSDEEQSEFADEFWSAPR